MLTQIDLENFYTIGRNGFQEFFYRLPRCFVALSQRTEANRGSPLCQILGTFGKWDIIPCHVLADLILRNTCATKRNLYCSRWIIGSFNQIVEIFLFQGIEYFLS